MGRGSRMDHEAPGIADIGEMRKSFYGIDELLSRLQSSRDPETHQRPKIAAEMFHREMMARMIIQTGRVYPVDQRMTFQEFCHL
jgi:hypothetical protein